jgi:hypothetical protein
MQRFEEGDFPCKDEARPGRLLLGLAPALSRFLLEYPFTRGRIIAVHIGVVRDSVKKSLARENILPNSQGDGCHIN